MEGNTQRNSIEQARAKAAFDAATIGKEKYGKEYESFVNELPMLIKTNSLGAAIAYASYKNAASKLVNEQLSHWLKQGHNQHLLGNFQDRLDATLMKCESTTYKAVTLEVLAFLTWLRRFAKALAA